MVSTKRNRHQRQALINDNQIRDDEEEPWEDESGDESNYDPDSESEEPRPTKKPTKTRVRKSRCDKRAQKILARNRKNLPSLRAEGVASGLYTLESEEEGAEDNNAVVDDPPADLCELKEPKILSKPFSSSSCKESLLQSHINMLTRASAPAVSIATILECQNKESAPQPPAKKKNPFGFQRRVPKRRKRLPRTRQVFLESSQCVDSKPVPWSAAQFPPESKGKVHSSLEDEDKEDDWLVEDQDCDYVFQNGRAMALERESKWGPGHNLSSDTEEEYEVVLALGYEEDSDTEDEFHPFPDKDDQLEFDASSDDESDDEVSMRDLRQEELAKIDLGSRSQPIPRAFTTKSDSESDDFPEEEAANKKQSWLCKEFLIDYPDV